MLPISLEEFNSKTIKSKHEFKTFGLSRNETKEFRDELVTSKVGTRRDGDMVPFPALVSMTHVGGGDP